MTESDDAGVFEWKPLQIKMRIFPADAVDVAAMLAELVKAGCLSKTGDRAVQAALTILRRPVKATSPAEGTVLATAN